MENVTVQDLFTETKQVLAEYQAQALQLDNQERELYAELSVLQEEMTNNILEQESAGVSELVYLKISAKEINQKTDIIKVLLEELAEEKTALKLKFTPVLRDALKQDGAKRKPYNANEIVEKYRYLMLKEVAEIGEQMYQQYQSVAPEVYEVFDDKEVKKAFPRLEYAFHREQFEPSFSWQKDSVITKQEVFTATRGALPNTVIQPKEKDVQ